MCNTYASGATSYFDVYSVAGGRINGTGGLGLVTYNRYSQAQASASFYNSSFPNGVNFANALGLNASVPPPGSIYLFRQNNDGNARNTHKMSFFAIHAAMQPSQSLEFYNAVQQLRIDFGGGYR